MLHSQDDHHPWARLISWLMGWTYFFLWSLSFYPQPLHNLRRRSTRGFSIDFCVANIVGLSCYAAANALLLYAPAVRAEYAARHPESPDPPIAFNDVAYAVHGAVLVLVVLSQFSTRLWGLDVGLQQRPSRAMLAICGSLLGLVALSVAFVGVPAPWSWARRASAPHARRTWAWLDVADCLGTVKVALTAIKYTPQAWSNYRERSTAGFNVTAVVMDLVGAVLSLGQLVLDAAYIRGGDWSDVTRNPGKFGLGNVSLLYDVIFLWQHFVLYRHNEVRSGSGDRVKHKAGDVDGNDNGDPEAVPDEQTSLLRRHSASGETR